MIRRTIHLLIVAGILWAGWHATPVYWNYFAFKEAVEETALFAGARATEADLRARILKLAADHNVPLEPGALVVRIDAEVTEIRAPYTESVELLPRYFYDWTFDVKTSAWRVPGGRR
jgi:hypothetical protein